MIITEKVVPAAQVAVEQAEDIVTVCRIVESVGEAAVLQDFEAPATVQVTVVDD